MPVAPSDIRTRIDRVLTQGSNVAVDDPQVAARDRRLRRVRGRPFPGNRYGLVAPPSSARSMRRSGTTHHAATAK